MIDVGCGKKMYRVSRYSSLDKNKRQGKEDDGGGGVVSLCARIGYEGEKGEGACTDEMYDDTHGSSIDLKE